MRRWMVVVGLGIAAALGAPKPGAAQDVDQHQRWASATWTDDLNFFSMNALLGGLAAGVQRVLHHGSFAEGFTRGALGGGVSYLGKRTAVARFSGAGFLGREVNAVGASITRNAALGVGILDTLVLPVGPVLAFVDPRHIAGSRLRLDLNQAYWLAYALTEKRLALDWSRTLSAGAPVFQATRAVKERGKATDGIMVGGMVVMSPSLDGTIDDVFAHERVHVLQRDFIETALGVPLEGWAASKLRLGRVPLFDRVVPGVGYLPFDYLLVGPWKRSQRLYEVEAYFLETRR
ncbi:MAG: hypothetical protein LJF04_15880 [Gemmatimonadetes bacterium]|nr:hypothetical protein [Gemmatimonadota bacterium]